MPFVGGPDTRITNSTWRTAAILEKSLYLGRGLTDFDKIWHALQFNACDASHSYKFAISKNPTWRRPPFWKKTEKSSYLGRSFSDFNEIWQDDAVRPSWPFGPLQIWNLKKSKMAAADILKKF